MPTDETMLPPTLAPLSPAAVPEPASALDVYRGLLGQVDPRAAERLALLGSPDDPVYRLPARGRSRWRGDVAATVAGLGAGACVAAALTVGWEGRGGPGGWLTLGGQVTAMLGTYLALVSVLLASRLPWLEREVGHDRMVAWHRTAGPAALFLIAAHVLLTTLGWAMASGVGPVAQFTELVLQYEWMMPALAAFIIMMALGLSSWPRIRRRLKYETWHVAHLYFYVAILLAYGHQVAFGTMFAEYPWMGTAWLTLYALVLGAILLFRVLTPIVHALRYRLRVDDVVEEAPGVVSLYLRGRGLDRMRVKGGQFYAWRFMTREYWWQAHPYSLSAGRGDCLRITVKALGDQSRSLVGLKVGTRVIAEGPYGVFTADKRHSNHVVGIAAGVGITPIRSMLDDLPDHADVTVIYRVRAEVELALREELDDAALKTGWNVVYLTGDNDAHPITPQFLQRHAPRILESDVYLCGPGPFASLVLGALGELGLPEHRVHHEQFAF